MIDINVDALAEHDPCEFAKHRYNSIAKFRFLWTLLVFIFGSFLLVILVAVLFLVIAGQPTAAIITGVGAVVDGAGVVFLVTRKNESKAEEEQAYEDVKARCDDAVAQADQMRRSLRVLGMR